MSDIINLTQHVASKEQTAVGVFNLPKSKRILLHDLLTFDTAATQEELAIRGASVALLAVEAGAKKALIGGAPFFMRSVEKSLRQVGITPVYSFSKRRLIENKSTNDSQQEIQDKKGPFIFICLVEPLK